MTNLQTELNADIAKFIADYNRNLAIALNWTNPQGRLTPGVRAGTFLLNRKQIKTRTGRANPNGYSPYEYNFDLVHQACFDIETHPTETSINSAISTEVNRLEDAVVTAREQTGIESTSVLVKSIILESVNVTKIKQQIADGNKYIPSDRHWDMFFVSQVNIIMFIPSTIYLHQANKV